MKRSVEYKQISVDSIAAGSGENVKIVKAT